MHVANFMGDAVAAHDGTACSLVPREDGEEGAVWWPRHHHTFETLEAVLWRGFGEK